MQFTYLQNMCCVGGEAITDQACQYFSKLRANKFSLKDVDQSKCPLTD